MRQARIEANRTVTLPIEYGQLMQAILALKPTHCDVLLPHAGRMNSCEG